MNYYSNIKLIAQTTAVLKGLSSEVRQCVQKVREKALTTVRVSSPQGPKILEAPKISALRTLHQAIEALAEIERTIKQGAPNEGDIIFLLKSFKRKILEAIPTEDRVLARLFAGD